MPRSQGRQGGPSQPRQVLDARVAPYHGPARAPAARRPAARPSFSSRSDQQNQPPARHDNNSTDLGIATRLRARRAAVQNGQRGQRDGRPDAEPAPPPPPPVQGRVRRARIALKPLKPHVSIRDDLGPQTAPNLEYRQLLEGSDSEAKAFRESARSYNNALSFTSLAAHWDQTQVGTLGPPVFRVFGRLYHRLGALLPAVNQRPAFAQTWLIDPAEATNTRLGPDSADNRVQRSTLTKLESMLQTGNRFVREFASAKARAGWDTAKDTEMAMLICDSDTNTGDRGPQDLILQVHGDRCPDGRPKYQIVSSLHPSAMPLRYPLLFPAGEDGFHPNIPLCGFHQAGPPIARNREQIDNAVQLREVLASLGLDDEDEEEDDHSILYVALSRAMSVDRIKVLLPSRDPADDDDDLPAVDRTAAATTVTPNPVLRSVLRAMNGE
ncbi:BZ3501_MvSof-1269-A2-R1_Chr12-3g03579 [Microbotryum saponariae]|nr:BZ3501_MvSof-1269-A2-R1_Chr12-3g03579 [Microbotryum saponariae]